LGVVGGGRNMGLLGASAFDSISGHGASRVEVMMRNGRGGVRLHLAGLKHRRRGRERRSSPGDRVCSRLPALAVLTEASELVWCYARGFCGLQAESTCWVPK
jgi:hypothetical protein